MVLAVNWAPQAPAEGQATCSSSSRSSADILPTEMLADRLEQILHGDRAAAIGAGKDRAAIDEDRRHVEPAHGHHHAGQRLVAAGQADQRIVAMAAHGELDGIGDDLARRQRGLHALMAHGDAVGDGDGAEFARRAVAPPPRPASPPAPGASARCCKGRLRSSRWRRRRRAGGSARATDPWRNNRNDAAPGRDPRSHAGWANATYRTSWRPFSTARMRCKRSQWFPATATHWYRPPPPVLAPARTLQRYPGRRSSYKC